MRCKGRAAVIRRGHVAHAVSKKTQRPLRCNRWVQLAHSTSSSVARVDESFFAFHALGNFGALALVKGFKVVAAHVDLAADFQHCGCILG